MPVREPKAGSLRPPPPERPAPDRVGDERAGGTPAGLRDGLAALLGPDKVLGGVSDLVRYASDASPYRFVPQVVVVPQSVQDVVRLMEYARRERRSLVFRAAGTSLAGQAQGEDILVDVRRHFSGVDVEAAGTRARILPGTVLARANAALARYGRVLGPDPASAAAATVGGVLATNASGPAGGPAHDSYRTVVSLTAVLPSGTVLDTADPDADAALAAAEPELFQGLLDLRDEIEADPALTARIRAKHAIPNAGGYRLDAFLDAETPAQILRGLLIGSQGTLGFVAEAVYATLPLRPAVTTAALFFPTLPAAAAAVPLFAQGGAAAVELLDGRTLRACASVEGVPPQWAALPAECAALLVEFRAADEVELAAYERVARRLCDDLGLVRPVPSAVNAFTRDREATAALWRAARQAFVAAPGAARPPGTTLVGADFAVPPDRLAHVCAELVALQRRYGFAAAVAGHAAQGALRFPLAFDPADPADTERYAAFLDDFCRTVVERFDGSLTARHGTGRALAPYLEAEWGPRASALMWRVKRLLDPDAVLAPRVVLDQDPRGHLRGLKTFPAIEAVADSCVECGLCEPVCPSRDLTTSPRQRIVLRREMFRQPPGSPVLDRLLDAYGYDAVDTCAGESLCRTSCPAGIDTGALMRDFRAGRHTRARERAATALAGHWRAAERAARTAAAGAAAAAPVRRRSPARLLTGPLRGAGRGRGTAAGDGGTGGAASTAGAGSTGGSGGASATGSGGPADARPPGLPGPAPRLPRTGQQGAAAVYFPSCACRILGPPAGSAGPWLPEALVAVSARAGLPVWIPPDVAGTCCAAPWYEQGLDEATVVMANRVVEQAWTWTTGGRLPVVVDAASCTLGLTQQVVPYLTDANRELHGELTVLDSVVWAAEHLLPRLTVRDRVDSAVLHPACAARHLDADGAFLAVARACAREVVLPDDAGCCALTPRAVRHPALSAAATRREAEEVAARAYDAYLSAGRLCEWGMERATGEPYESVIVALERATR
ncbi:FAD-binding and (Fe-S)-binding domain-containing protein [Streptomyces sp. HPF1205]|uniref:FAD-binding and (Fe-S)-binding domain-containing protein n=1 Tax=Streptomyces sp. HPF1205 TaxID=2873262 RepID=UPI001CEC60D4|nr:FAD-binding and (Fe-S)-binding domain-containing protein [Streptomyces sp. HPF1205]